MIYTIISAQYANEDHTAAVIDTAEAAAVLVSEKDTPDLWAEMLDWGSPAAYVAPTPQPEPSPIEKLAAFLAANPDVKALIEAS
jgi:hypothetical protein